MSIERIKMDLLVNSIADELRPIFNNNKWNLRHLDGCIDQIIMNLEYGEYCSLYDAIEEWEKDTLENCSDELKK